MHGGAIGLPAGPQDNAPTRICETGDCDKQDFARAESGACVNIFRAGVFRASNCAAELAYPNSQDPGLAIGLCSLINMMPLTMRISDHRNHQARTRTPTRTKHSRKPITRYSNPIQKVLI